jgi:two-component system phosphate regulon sensor histidine kinase PhoR
MEAARGSVSILARAWDISLPAHLSEGRLQSGPRDAPGRVLVLTDITELTKIVQMKNDFVANASHELRTPLSAIRASVETLMVMKPIEEDSSASRFLQMMDRHTRRLEALVTDLLDLSRVESAPQTFKPVKLKLSEFCDQLSTRWATAAEAKGLSWRCDVRPEAGTVEANDQLLALTLDNLIDNAVRFTDHGGEVRLSCRGDDQAAYIEVADTGCGIAPEEHERVFERFYQVEKARSGVGAQGGEGRGTGLGLSIVKHAVAAMRGRVTLESDLGQGTRVTVTIPRAGA